MAGRRIKGRIPIARSLIVQWGFYAIKRKFILVITCRWHNINLLINTVQILTIVCNLNILNYYAISQKNAARTYFF